MSHVASQTIRRTLSQTTGESERHSESQPVIQPTIQPVIQVEHLRYSYGSFVAVDDCSFDILPGEIFGLVGPNGAGKTTTVECIEGLRAPTSGSVRVLGRDPLRQRAAVAALVGIQMQETALPARLTVSEALDLYAAFYPRSVDRRKLLEQVGLVEKQHTRFGKLSGGQKQRLFIALALVHDPSVIFLDELTTGLDPQARRAIWDLIGELRQRGKTILLISHAMEEVERLCDRVAILDHGAMLALDTPANLLRRVEGDIRISFSVPHGTDGAFLANLPDARTVERTGDDVTITGGSDAVVMAVTQALVTHNIRFSEFRVERPTLDDLFLQLTGRAIRD